MVAPRPPLTVSSGYAVVSCELSIRILALVCAGTLNSLLGKLVGMSIPVARTTCPAGASFISIGGRGREIVDKYLENKTLLSATPGPAYLPSSKSQWYWTGHSKPNQIAQRPVARLVRSIIVVCVWPE